MLSQKLAAAANKYHQFLSRYNVSNVNESTNRLAYSPISANIDPVFDFRMDYERLS